VDQARRWQTGRAALEGAFTILALMLTLLVTTVVARRISRRLGRLRDTANDVAFDQLPAVVQELRAADPMTVRPDQVAAEVAPEPAKVTGDEIGEVALAFAHVHRAAVRTAAEQAVMRAATAEIFVHLSRREQRLVDAVLAKVDEVEKDEADPDRLEKLYQLDNLATRMARINSSLLVLGGAGSGRVRHEDVPLVKVLQAALSQVEHYRRVRIGMIDDGVGLAAECVDEIVHLLAELLDNATLYSPPENESWMTARALHDRVVIQIGDEGVGLPTQRRDELNALLHRPPAVDVAAVRAMGLTVVGHLAMRYGIRVELRPGPKLGTIAEVEIPLGLTRPTAKTAPLPATRGSAPVGVPVEMAVNGNGHKGNGHAVIDVKQPSRVADLDHTMQLPIFSQVSGWFRGEAGEQAADWTSPADEGWQQAQRVIQATPRRQTASGLPVRNRGEHLVPGAVEVAPDREPGADQRDPERVASAMAAYARGVATRRINPVKQEES
jgi:signal transduction histidine kinase